MLGGNGGYAAVVEGSLAATSAGALDADCEGTEIFKIPRRLSVLDGVVTAAGVVDAFLPVTVEAGLVVSLLGVGVGVDGIVASRAGKSSCLGIG